ncbi:hypothetical protein ACIFOT_01755 [Neobacillus sp. NRS-1170]|uniref:hypothetical protein n=1 Tax=Neobacillus sp. NRS-1170 TaxID=3233898 RepID=UPI003D2A0CAD
MKDDNFTHHINTLIKNYEQANGRARFEMIKVNDTLIYTDIDQSLLDFVNLKRHDIIGKTFFDLPIKKHWAGKMSGIYENVWKGNETGYYSFPYSNENIFLIIAIRPIIVNGKTVKIEGRCAPIENKEFDKGFSGTLIFLKDF